MTRESLRVVRDDAVDVTPIMCKRYVYRRPNGSFVDGGRIPLRRRVRARWGHFVCTGKLTYRDLVGF